MFFSALKIDYETFLNDPSYKIENKQRINLSEHAYETFINDQLLFNYSSSNEPVNINSSLINTIFRNYRCHAKVSISHQMENKESELQELFSSFEIDERTKYLKVLINEFESSLLEITNTYAEKGIAFYIRIDSENLAFLATDGQIESCYYDDNIGTYIKSVLEEFSRLPYVERETYYHIKSINTFNLSLHNKKLLKLTLLTKSMQAGHSYNNILYMKPVKILRDKEMLYNYLVGYIGSERNGTWRIGALRLSSILELHALESNYFLSKSNLSYIDETIKIKGVQFLSEEIEKEKILVQFTPKGEQMYKRMLHLRPSYLSKNDDLIYSFLCTPFQAENYFFKFGEDAIIVEPTYLAKKLQKKHCNAVQKYATLNLSDRQ